MNRNFIQITLNPFLFVFFPFLLKSTHKRCYHYTAPLSPTRSTVLRTNAHSLHILWGRQRRRRQRSSCPTLYWFHSTTCFLVARLFVKRKAPTLTALVLCLAHPPGICELFPGGILARGRGGGQQLAARVNKVKEKVEHVTTGAQNAPSWLIERMYEQDSVVEGIAGIDWMTRNRMRNRNSI